VHIGEVVIDITRLVILFTSISDIRVAIVTENGESRLA